MMRTICRYALLLCLSCFSVHLYAQNAAITGQVQDSSGAVIRGAEVRIVEQAQGTTRTVHTNDSGSYNAPFLNPGPYRVYVQAPAFSTAVSDPIILTVGQTLVFNVRLKVGSAQQEVTVDAGSQLLNTTDASVSTVVDRQFVSNMPLNGRSFQSLILLAPGVLTTSPQNGTVAGSSGEFSVNGQRTDANSYSVDGVSANNGISTTGGTAGSAGTLASFSALGTTQALVPVDALQEFRITTSTYSAEYGRQPGAQVQFETRSGTNDFHGTLFEFLRNDALDANNWFNDNNSPVIAKPAERQNDFGGVLGGPVDIPKLYSGKNRAFFFASYEGLRLTQPQPAQILYVPSNGTYNTAAYSDSRYENLRANAPLALQPVLNAFPQPNCSTQQNAQCIDYGDGLSPYILSTSLPSRLNSVGGRLDVQALSSLRLFIRYADTISSAVSSITTATTAVSYRNQTVTFGADSTLSPSTSNQFRLGYSPTHGVQAFSSTVQNGAAPVDLHALEGADASGLTEVALSFPSGKQAVSEQGRRGSRQHQWNAVDTFAWSMGHHLFRTGIDYRRTTSYTNAPGLSDFPLDEYIYSNATAVLNNGVNTGLVEVSNEQDPAFTNFSAFFQDEWRVHPRLDLSLGLRWELNPPPTVVGGVQQRTLDGSFSNPASLTLAPVGTPLYNTTYYNFAPRLGVAAKLHDQPGHETVFRTGAGVYFDTGQNFNIYGFGASPGIGATVIYQNSTANPVSFPFTPTQRNIVLSDSAPYGTMSLISRSLQLPYTFQWNVSLEQAFGNSQSVTIGYVGSNGRRLLTRKPYSLHALNPNFLTVQRFQNGSSSSYNGLQLQYKRSLSRGLQAVVGYTWAHAFDYQSQDSAALPYQRGNSDFDVRNNFTAAVSYNPSWAFTSRWHRGILNGWGTDLRFTARTAFPVELQGPQLTDAFGSQYFALLNYNGSKPYVYKPGIPGGRQFNPSAFSVPLTGQNGNIPRNFLRGFGENEVNLAIRREFPVYEQLHLQFRIEAFNLLNHPNFGYINATCGTSTAGATCTNSLLGQATNTLAKSLGGGLTQLYQQGGPRSLQAALKFVF